jgi:uncharacterized membrane protein YeaQ/YmgE (transglycosylase-associated protein family)
MLLWVVITIVAGAIIGWLASIAMKTSSQMGVLANIVVGAVGSFIGHWLGGVLGLGDFGTLGRFGLAVLGAVILIAVLRALKIYR